MQKNKNKVSANKNKSLSSTLPGNALLGKQVVSGAPYFDYVAHSKCVTFVTPLNFNSMAHFGMRHRITIFWWRICV
jgi:hypothetical protein